MLEGKVSASRIFRNKCCGLLTLSAVYLSLCVAGAEADKVLFDFESGSFSGWRVDGHNPFGKAPFRASAAVPKWRSDRNFKGWQGNYMVIAGDTRPSQVNPGKITSPEFVISHPYLKFYFGGEVHPRVRVFLMVGSREVRNAFGNNSYDMRLRGWDVSEFRNQRGRITIEDTAEVPSLLRVDHFHLSETPPPPIEAVDDSAQESSVLRYGELKFIFDPGSGRFVAHASIVRGLDERWHMYAQIASLAERNKPDDHKAIWHATAEDLHGPWSKAQPVLTADSAFGESFMWQPFVMVHKGQYWMFYVGSGVVWKGWDRNNNWRMKDFGKLSTQGPYGIHLATSKDGLAWERHSTLPLFTDSPFAFTPFVMPSQSGWIMYYAAAEPPHITGKHAIVSRTSSDLTRWENRRVALVDTSETTPWPERSFFHSPVVFKQGPSWYLLAGPIDSANQARFHYRRLFKSNNPLKWSLSNHLKGIFLEGGANLVRDGSKMFLTHTGAYAGGVWIGSVVWNPPKLDQPRRR